MQENIAKVFDISKLVDHANKCSQEKTFVMERLKTGEGVQQYGMTPTGLFFVVIDGIQHESRDYGQIKYLIDTEYGVKYNGSY